MLAMTRSLGATKSVLEVQLKWPSVMKKNAQLLLLLLLSLFKVTMMSLAPNDLVLLEKIDQIAN